MADDPNTIVNEKQMAGHESWYATEIIGQTYTLTVSRAGDGSGTVISSPTGINCGADCTAPYNSGTLVTLTATPASGSIFTGWSGGVCSGTGSCTVTMDTAKSVTATFAVNTAASIAGKISVNVAGHNNLGVANATITLQDTGLSTTTDNDGNFTISNIQPGTYQVIITSPDTGGITQQITLSTSQNLQLNIPTMTILKGDASGNGRLGLEDCIYILQILSGAR